MKFLDEFKQFASRSNMVDLAIGVVVGGAASSVVSSFVNDLFLPPISFLMSRVNLKDLRWVLRLGPDGSPSITIAYGNFIQVLINFLLVSLAIFFVVKLLNRLRRKDQEQQSPPPTPPVEVKLLTEIRDLLKQNASLNK